MNIDFLNPYGLSNLGVNKTQKGTGAVDEFGIGQALGSLGSSSKASSASTSTASANMDTVSFSSAIAQQLAAKVSANGSTEEASELTAEATGTNLLKDLEGYLNEVDDNLGVTESNLDRMKELASKVAEGDYTEHDRKEAQKEIEQLQASINNIATEISKSATNVGAASVFSMNSEALGVSDVDLSTPELAQKAVEKIDNAIYATEELKKTVSDMLTKLESTEAGELTPEEASEKAKLAAALQKANNAESELSLDAINKKLGDMLAGMVKGKGDSTEEQFGDVPGSESSVTGNESMSGADA